MPVEVGLRVVVTVCQRLLNQSRLVVQVAD